MKRKDVDMLNGPLLPSIISYTIPIILTSILQLLFNSADLAVVGQFGGGSNSVAAVSSTSSITRLLVNLFIGLGGGVTVTISHALGGNRQEEVHRIVHTALPTAVISGAVLTVIGILFAEPLLMMMHTTADILPLATVYMRYYFAGMIFNLVYNFCSAILRAAGDTRSPLLFLTIAGVANVLINLFFVIVLQMDVAGVALATTISQAISAVLVVWALVKRTDICHLELRKLQIHGRTLARIARYGIPGGIQGSLFSISNVILQSAINSFDINALVAGNGAAATLDGYLQACTNAFHLTSVNFIGQNRGAKQYDRIKKVFVYCLGCAFALTLAASICMYLFGSQLLSIFVPEAPEAIGYGLIRMTYVSLPYALLALMDVTTGSSRGLGASMTPTCISILSICVFRVVWIKSIFQIPAYHTLNVLYWSYPISWILSIIGQGTAFVILYRRLLRKNQQLQIP